jgi:succinate-acetate transporter protein
LSTTDESPAPPAIADPAPLGLAGFALTTFLLSAFNAGWTRGGGGEWLAFAFAYGGVAQLLAGMWEFRNRNVFGATAFGTYGSFWIGLFFYFHFIVPTAGENVGNDLGWILLAFAIFNIYMTLLSAQANTAVFGVFFFLEIALIVLFIGNFASNTNLLKFGGYLGVVTAVIAWYASAAGIANGMGGRIRLPVGPPVIRPVS